jgi:energy-coupling factor transporter ATP-binding protein EcfA2
MDIIIHKEDFIDSLLNLGNPIVPKANNCKQIVPSIKWKSYKDNSIQYFPFNPTFETSDAIMKSWVQPSGNILDETDIDEQELLWKFYENSKEFNSKSTIPKPFIKESKSVKPPPSKDKVFQKNKPRHSIQEIEKCQKEMAERKFRLPEISENILDQFNFDGFDNTPPTKENTGRNADLGEIDFEQGNAKVNSSDSNNHMSQYTPKNGKKVPDIYDSAFFDEDFSLPMPLMGNKNKVKEIEVKKKVETKAEIAMKKSNQSKVESKIPTINFSELDYMGDLLDWDLNGDVEEDEYLNQLLPNKAKPKSTPKKEERKQRPVEYKPNSTLKISESYREAPSTVDAFLGMSFPAIESKFVSQNIDPEGIDIKKTKSQHLKISDFSFTNSRSIQSLNNSQKDKMLLKLLKDVSSFKEKLRLAESEIIHKENHIKHLKKDGNSYPLAIEESRLHLAFLFSSPLIRRTNASIENIMQLDYLTEINDILKVCGKRKYEMRFKTDVATLSNLRSTITDCPFALHFSGHGIQNIPENLGSEFTLFKDKGNILLLEDEHGMADYFFEEDLKYMIEVSQNTFEVVFVSSCYSQFAGEVFLNAGAKHVICIRSGERISDKASLRFSRVFYETLFVKNYNVCTSFAIAKEEVSKVINSSEANKFLLLIHGKDNFGLDPMTPCTHKCYCLSNLQPGSVINIDEKPVFDSIPSNVECFIGRQQDMYEIINLLDYHRLVSILGPPGIGKTSLARHLANYLKDRKKFSDGIIYVTLRGWESADMFLTRLSLIIRAAWSMEEYKKYGLEEIDKKSKESNQQEMDQIDSSQYRSFILNMLKDKEVLLILDNAEDPLEDDNERFIGELDAIIDHWSKIKFLATTRKWITKLTHNPEKPFILQPLSKEASLKLLITKAPRDIKNQELEELLKCKVNYTQQETLTLLNHPFTALLGGHPQAISLAAPLLEYKSLKELFLAFCDSNVMDAIDYPTNTKDPNKSLRLSLELSIKHMKNTMPEALNLFSFIGLLPGGVNEEELTQMWESTKWVSLKDALVRASLLVYKTDNKGKFVFSMLPFMSIRAYELLEENEERRHSYHMKCCKLYKEYLYDFYGSEKSISQLESLTAYESNIWAWIYRSLNRKKNIEYDNDELRSNYSDYFISDQERSIERLSISRVPNKKYKEKEERMTMEKLVEADKESSDSDNSDDGSNISKIFKNSEVHRSSERNNYKSHFQLSPKESKNNDDDEKESETRKFYTNSSFPKTH